MAVLHFIKYDLAANQSNTKGKVVAVLFRLAASVAKRKWSRIVFLPYLLLYRLLVEWVLGIELPWQVKAGKGLRIFHGQALVVHKETIIGQQCTLRQSTTIGNTKEGSPAPVIGNNVDIGSNVCILGPITIGDNVIIGAGSVVVKSIPPNSIAVGNPARVIKTITQID